MKKLIFIPVVMFCITLAAQTINNIPVKEIDVEYIEIIGTSKFMSNKVTIEISFGQRNKFFNMKDAMIIDSEGKPIVFNSMVDALNFMSENGYEFVTAYAFGDVNVASYRYIMRKRKQPEKEKI